MSPLRKRSFSEICEFHILQVVVFQHNRIRKFVDSWQISFLGADSPILNKPHSTDQRYKSYPVSREPSVAFAPLSLRYCSDTGPLLLRSTSTHQILQFNQNNAERISISKKYNPPDYDLTPGNQEQE